MYVLKFSDHGVVRQRRPSGGSCLDPVRHKPDSTGQSGDPTPTPSNCNATRSAVVLQVQHAGECELPPHCLKCSEDYAPVCGVDKLTYVNPCVAECSRVAVLKAGVCSKTLVIKPQQSGKRGSLGARRQLAGEASVAAGWRRRLMHHP